MLATIVMGCLLLPCSGLAGDSWSAKKAAMLPDPGRKLLQGGFLKGSKEMESPVPTQAFTPPDSPRKPFNRFRGRLKIIDPFADGHAEAVRDNAGRIDDPLLDIRFLPPLDTEFVQFGNDIIPVVRGTQPGSHPHWEWILEPGKVWDEPRDKGYSRASIPFSLQQRNQNCTHHGMLTFLFRNDGRTSRMAYQVVSETCILLMADLWGVLKVRYTPEKIDNSREIILRYRQDVANRLPVKPIEALADDYPGVDPANFLPLSPEFTTVYGVVSDGIHYLGGCQTRYGTYPFCELLDLPSYSTSKSTFAGLVFMFLQQLYPSFANEKVTDWVPECVLGDGRWNSVEIQHLVNMSTGLYNSDTYMRDEDEISGSAFIRGERHADKINFACGQYERNRDPGEHWVYHTSDTYIAGVLMNGFVRQKFGPDTDVFSDLLVPELWERLKLSAVSGSTRRTYDTVAQPFTGYGLTYHPDDIARIAKFLNMDDGRIADQMLFDQAEFDAAMQRVERIPIEPLESRRLNYRNGFWAANAGIWANCSGESWAPFMSGFGGITVAMLPNDTVYYYFSDSGNFNWITPAREAHKIRSICAD